MPCDFNVKVSITQLRLGKYEYSGNITATVGLEYFPYKTANTQSSTIDVINGVCHDYPNWRLMRELSLLDIPEDALYRPFSTLSNGEQTKVLLATLFLRENSFLLIDEPTNHLDMAARSIVSDYLKTKKGFILVSHDRAFLDNCVDHILSINKTNIEIQRGNFSSWFVNKERQDNFELAANNKLRKDIKRLSASAKLASSWSLDVEKTKYDTKISGLRPDRGYIGHKAAKMMKRSKNIESRRQSAIDEKAKLLKNIESADSLKVSQLAYHTNRFVSLSGVSIAYGEKAVCLNVSFTIERGDRIALCGKNGSGKSSVIKLICGKDIPHSGEFYRGSGLAISYVSLDASFLSGNLSGYAKRCAIDESLFKAILRQLDFSRTQFAKDMRDFSDGQKKKVLIARSICEKAHLHIWDEPLNFIDIYSRMQIERLILEYRPTILFVEHDSIFCDTLATKKVVLN